MEEYILFAGEIQGQYREVEIYPIANEPNEFLVHWDGVKMGSIHKMDNQWHTKSQPLKEVVQELGRFIDSKDGEM
jgi:hypothetical protein